MSQNFNSFDLLVPPERPDTFYSYSYKIKRDLWEDSFNKLKTEKRPNIQELEDFFSQPPYFFNTIFHSLKLKYRALTTELTVIKKTMTPWQLYSANSPHWTNKLTAEEADAILMHTVGTCTLTENEFNDMYQKAIDGELTKKPFVLNLWQ